MGVVQDVLKAIESLDFWRRLKPVPEKVEELERRIAALEARLTGVGGLAQCPVCKSEDFKVTASRKDKKRGADGVMADFHRCGSCGHEEQRLRHEGPGPR